MVKFLKRIFGFEPPPDYSHLIKQGAAIVDVRTPAEFKQGHIRKSANLPLDQLRKSVKLLPADKQLPIIVCCASGMRSGSAKTVLNELGYKNVYNGGGWLSLRYELKKAGYDG
jgi:rhodanese-related sulfurtransferase